MRDESKQPKNTALIDMEDLPREKVVRSDGLVTIDDLAALMGKPVPGDDKKEVTTLDQPDSPESPDSPTEVGNLKNFIEVIIRLPKP